jgi:hypothetical protein
LENLGWRKKGGFSGEKNWSERQNLPGKGCRAFLPLIS